MKCSSVGMKCSFVGMKCSFVGMIRSFVDMKIPWCTEKFLEWREEHGCG
jgi:hypothetical protein